MKILLTGVSGFIGKSLLVRLLNNKIYNVATVSRTPLKIADEVNYNFDLTNYNELSTCLCSFRPDIIVHLAAAGVRQGKDDIENIFGVNSFSAYHMLEICKENEINPKFIIASSGFEYANSNEALDEHSLIAPSSLYGISKATQTMLLQEFQNDFSIDILRFFGVYGIGEGDSRLIPYIVQEGLRGNEIKLTGGQQLRDFLYIDDAVEALIKFIHIQNDFGLNIFNVSTGKPVSLKTVVETIRQKMQESGINLNVVYGALPYRENEPMVYTANVSKVIKYLDWSPRIDIDQGIEKILKDIYEKFGR